MNKTFNPCRDNPEAARKFCLGLISFLFALSVFHVAKAFDASRSFAQLAALPFVVLVFVPLKVPRLILGLSVVLGALGVGAAYGYKSEDPRGFWVARFSGDELEVAASSFRNRLNSYLQVYSDIKAVRHPDLIGSDKEAQNELANGVQKGLIWGSERWLNISFPFQEPRPLWQAVEIGGSGRDLWPAFKYKFVSSVPVIGLSRKPESHTIRFVSSLFLGLLEREGSGRDLDLYDAASLSAGWTTSAHRAYPLWVLGNRHLLDSIDGLSFEPGELKCALKMYRLAIGFLNNPGGNPDLFSAIMNNYGLALRLRYDFQGRKRLKRKVIKAFRAAKRGGRAVSGLTPKPVVWKAAKFNLRTAVENIKGGKIKRKLRKRRKVRKKQKDKSFTPSEI